MDDEEIMKQFEAAFNMEKVDPAPTYKATRNLNTEIANPNIDVNNNINVNIINENIEENNNSNVSPNNNYVDPVEYNNIRENEKKTDVNVNNSVKTVYKPTMESKKKTQFKLSPELLICLIIAFILFVFILVMPSISDYFRDIKSGFLG